MGTSACVGHQGLCWLWALMAVATIPSGFSPGLFAAQRTKMVMGPSTPGPWCRGHLEPLVNTMLPVSPRAGTLSFAS